MASDGKNILQHQKCPSPIKKKQPAGHKPIAKVKRLLPTFDLRLPKDFEDKPTLVRLTYISELHIERITDFTAKLRIPLLLVWVPAPNDMFPPSNIEPLMRLHSLGRAMLRRVAEETTDIKFHDSAIHMPHGPEWRAKKGPFRLRDGHFNKAGAKWYGDLARPAVMSFLAAATSD